MRLDTVGKPPLVQTDNFSPAKLAKVQVEGVKESDAADTQSGVSNSSAFGKLFSIIKKAEDEHKKKKKGKVRADYRAHALQIYTRVGAAETQADQTGQSLNLKV
jgi:hypothetical protein